MNKSIPERENESSGVSRTGRRGSEEPGWGVDKQARGTLQRR